MTQSLNYIDLFFIFSVHDKKHVAHSRHPVAYPESYEGPAGSYSERERITDAHQSSSHNDSRYADVAPK